MLGGNRTFLPPSAIERGTSNYGSGLRMERLGQKLLQGQPVTVTFLGGSITWGRVRVLTWLLNWLPCCADQAAAAAAALQLFSRCQAAAMGGAAEALPITAKPAVCRLPASRPGPGPPCLHCFPPTGPPTAAPDPPLPPPPACLPACCRAATRAGRLSSASRPG